MENLELSTTYEMRNEIRQMKLNSATMNQIEWFIINQGIDPETARNQMRELSSEVATWLYPYVMGNTSPLINAIEISELSFMSQEAKEYLVNNLIFN
jgi:hypothetical protein